MREKLIQILEDYNGDPYNNPEKEISDHLLASLRCDKCKHWRRVPSYGDWAKPGCWKLGVSPEDRDGPAAPINYPSSDFFCAFWETK